MVIEALGGLVSSIAIIVILAVFIEMLLPNNGMAKYLRLIIGLFIIITILTPLMALLEQEDAFEVAAWSFATDNRQLESIIRTGEEMNRSSMERASEEYVKRIEGQIVALVRLIPGVDRVSATVSIHGSNDVRFGAIEGVIIWVSLLEGESVEEDLISGIDIVDIDLSRIPGEAAQPESTELNNNLYDINQIENRIRDTISNFYGLQREQIQIEWNL